MTDRTLEIARRLHALARTGLHFCQDEFDRQRFQEIEALGVELLAGPSADDRSQLAALWAGETGYVTPKIDVRAAIFDDEGRVLLVRERSDGCWTLPGGWADVNESPSQSIEKEIEQESGYQARVVKLAALYDRSKHAHGPSLFHSWKAYFLCEIEGGAPRTSDETDAVEWFTLDALPEMSLGRSTPTQVRRMREHWMQRELPADFD
ncbi:MAG TPA: NUDIX hydrolase [Steroidobacteraceae bacterium]